MLILAVIIALIVLFLHVCTWEGMIFQSVAEGLHDLPDWFKKPFFDCPICMCPWWGLLLYPVLLLSDAVPLMPWPAVILSTFMAGGINAVLIYIISADRAETKALKDAEQSESV